MSMRRARLLTGTQDRRAAGGTDTAELGRAFEAVRAVLGAGQDFPPAVIAEAQAVAATPALPIRDETSLPAETLYGELLRLPDRANPRHLAPVVGECAPGAEVAVRLVQGDVSRRSVVFQVLQG